MNSGGQAKYAEHGILCSLSDQAQERLAKRHLEAWMWKQKSSAKPEVANDHTMLSTPITMKILHIYFHSITCYSFKCFSG